MTNVLKLDFVICRVILCYRIIWFSRHKLTYFLQSVAELMIYWCAHLMLVDDTFSRRAQKKKKSSVCSIAVNIEGLGYASDLNPKKTNNFYILHPNKSKPKKSYKKLKNQKKNSYRTPSEIFYISKSEIRKAQWNPKSQT